RAARHVMVNRLRQLDVDALWLLLHPFGTSSAGPVALKRYIETCLDFQRLGLPLVAQHTGTIGIALLALNAVGGIECGVTLGERFDAGRLLKARDGGGESFGHPAMVYLGAINSYLDRTSAR